jgi:hypothetical protein
VLHPQNLIGIHIDHNPSHWPKQPLLMQQNDFHSYIGNHFIASAEQRAVYAVIIFQAKGSSKASSGVWHCQVIGSDPVWATQ